MNGFTWLLLAFPIYLFAKGRFVNYVTLTGMQTGAGEGVSNTGGGYLGLNNNQAIV